MPAQRRLHALARAVRSFADRGEARLAGLFMLASGCSFALFASVDISTATPARGAAATPAASADASVLAPLGLAPDFSPEDARAIAGIVAFAAAAGQPTATPTATATAQPPSPTPTLAPRQPIAPPPAPPAPTATVAPPPPAPALAPEAMDAYAQALFDATNQRRIASGLAPLRANGYLVAIARMRSRDMAEHNYFAHTSPATGDTAFSLMDRYGVPYGWAGENLAKNNYPDAESVAVADNALWSSPPHRENLLSPHYTDMGIALVVDASGMKYFTIVFTGPA